MLVGTCLSGHSTLPASRSKACPQRCCAFISSTGHQQAQLAQAAARTSAASEVCQPGIVAPVAGHLSGLFQLLDEPQTELSAQAQLNDRLTRCTSWEELAALLDANLEIVDFVNISTAWTRLATLFKFSGHHRRDGQAPPGAPPVRDPVFRRFLATLIDATSQQLRVFGVRALANVMWALSNADWQLEQHEPAVGKLMHEWCDRVLERLPELRAADVSNISTAIGRLDHRWRPDFVVEFYRSILHREDLLAHLDLTTLNNLLYGMSRARRRRLAHIGPATRRLLAQCVDRLLERPDREATGLVPWRAAQLLYNCHKVKLRVRLNTYTVLMPVVAEVYGADPNPMDRWSIGFLTGFVDAHRKVHPAVRPDLRPLYAYVERRLSEASTSQLAMLAHAFREMGCAPPAPFWGQLFSRYLVGAPLPPPAAAGAAAATAVAQQQQQLPDLLEGWGQPQQQPQQQQPQQVHGEALQVLSPPPLPPQARHLQQQQQQYAHLSRQQQVQAQQLQLQVQQYQQQAAQALQLQQRADHVGWAELPPYANSHPPEPHRTPQGHRAPHHLHPHYQQQEQQQPQSRQLPHTAQQQHRRALLPPGAMGAPESLQGSQPPQPQPPPQPYPSPQSPQLSAQPQSEAAAGQSLQLSQPQPPPPEQQQLLEPSQPPPSQPQPPLLQQQQQSQRQLQSQAPHPRPQSHSHPHPHTRPHSYPPPQPARAAASPQQQSDLAAVVPRLAVAMARAADRAGGGGAAVRGRDDDVAEPRTLHYVCWQAAKAGILPPRVFLRLYVERVPQWLARCADDTQVAQAVETLRLLRWVPRRELREVLCATLERRAATSRLPMRALLRWVRQQR